MFLPLSNLTPFQKAVLDPTTAAELLGGLSPEALAVGMGQSTFTPPRGLDDPAIAALAECFATNDGIAVLHHTIQYLRERARDERRWLEALAESSTPTTLVWGVFDDVSPVRVANHVWQAYLRGKPGSNEYWLLPAANHYLQDDQPDALVRRAARVVRPHRPGGPRAAVTLTSARPSGSTTPPPSGCPPPRTSSPNPPRRLRSPMWVTTVADGLVASPRRPIRKCVPEFEPSPTDPLHLVFLMKDIRRTLR